ncbi:phage tail terminator-like protein [Comamonas sp. B21-038]|uniref:phage tail terminator-like protein n=1 Tax=Comamonas sp. B21-038 TaxID=2918299 RepID=UPI001EFB1CE6|nr:phage tail terminator-like protein [Comamonas sp. B21-038]ULR87392.1 DUF4128 domain-containing protein [Comamonas sp. B21-038]
MTLSQIKALLEGKLLAMPGVLPTAFENVPFKPPEGPYQACYHLVNSPVDLGIEGTLTEERGILQITLRYPEGKGRQVTDAMADQLKQHFKPAQIIQGPGFRIELNKTPTVSSGTPDEGRWTVPVSIFWEAYPS